MDSIFLVDMHKKWDMQYFSSFEKLLLVPIIAGSSVKYSARAEGETQIAIPSSVREYFLTKAGEHARVCSKLWRK